MTNNLIQLNGVMVRPKADQIGMANEIVQQVVDGEIDPMGLHLQIKAIENILDGIKGSDAYKKAVISEAAKYKNQSFKGAFIEVKTKTNYSFDQDTKWKELDQAKKAREKMLKGIGLGMTLADVDTGEVLTCPVSGQTEYVMVKFE